jgi:hypothetical protein
MQHDLDKANKKILEMEELKSKIITLEKQLISVKNGTPSSTPAASPAGSSSKDNEIRALQEKIVELTALHEEEKKENGEYLFLFIYLL